MGKIKYPILDKDFLLKMLLACIDDRQRALIYILWLTGMHISSMTRLTPQNLKVEGGKTYLMWQRPKTQMTLRSEIPKEYVRVVVPFLESKKASRQHYHTIIKGIGQRAGFDDVSPMTFRHTRCLRALRKPEDGGEGYSVYEAPFVMGTTLDVAARNYAQLPREELEKHKMAEMDDRILDILLHPEAPPETSIADAIKEEPKPEPKPEPKKEG
ncbi:MAG: hypothetical protein MUP55_04115 [Candidatus Aenigmarchaeota archaeon]|nr:hypothetical protein [Candidatus Aenigmarchaeota archaeon]